MHIMLFGGSFDPPHLGHWQIAHTIIEKKIANQVWFIPCYSHPFAKDLSLPKHRLNMISFLTNHAILINDWEIKNKGTSYSFNTLRHFQITQPDNTFSWLIGSDQLTGFIKWKNYQDILKSTHVYVYPRKGFPFEPLYKNMIPLENFPLVTISSTQVRKAVKENKSIDNLVLVKVEEYLKKEKLYIMSS